MTGGLATPAQLATGSIRMSLNFLTKVRQSVLARWSQLRLLVTSLRRSITVALALGVLCVAAWPGSPYSRVGRALQSERIAAVGTPSRAGVHPVAAGSGCAACHAREMSVSGGACREPGPLFRMMLVD